MTQTAQIRADCNAFSLNWDRPGPTYSVCTAPLLAHTGYPAAAPRRSVQTPVREAALHKAPAVQADERLRARPVDDEGSPYG